jgi:hypothetical protein
MRNPLVFGLFAAAITPLGGSIDESGGGGATRPELVKASAPAGSGASTVGTGGSPLEAEARAKPASRRHDAGQHAEWRTAPGALRRSRNRSGGYRWECAWSCSHSMSNLLRCHPALDASWKRRSTRRHRSSGAGATTRFASTSAATWCGLGSTAAAARRCISRASTRAQPRRFSD